MASINHVLLNKGKRRLGRFPIHSSSSTAKKSDNAVNNFPQHRFKEESHTSFSASNDDTLLMEVEEMEAAMRTKNTDKDRKTELDDSLLKRKEANQNNNHSVDKTVLEKLPSSELKTRGCIKRSHMQSKVSAQANPKPMASGLQLKALETPKASRSRKNVNTPTASPLDKRQRYISKMLPAKKKIGKPLKFIDSHVGSKNHQTVANFESSFKQEDSSLTKGQGRLEISYSPLCSPPLSNSSICDITMEKSPPSPSRSSKIQTLLAGSVDKRNLSSKKNSTHNPKEAKSVIKTSNKVKKSLDLSSHKEVKNTPKISATPKRVTRSCVLQKKQSPPNFNSIEHDAFKVKRKSEGKIHCGKADLSKHEGKKSASSFKFLAEFTKNTDLSHPSSKIDTKAGLGPDCSESHQPVQTSGVSYSRDSLCRMQNTSSMSSFSMSEDKRQLDQWGLPEPVLEAYRNQGVTTMFDWQAECLLSDNVLGGGNLVFSAPTSAGKTLVAELLVLKRVVETKKKALFVLPFVSVAREKMYALQRLYQDAGIRVGGYMGSYNPPGGLSHLDVAVCTIEKGNGIINRLMEEDKLSDLGVMVVDELHMVGDSHRGYLLELMLTKLAFITRKAKSHSDESQHKVQLIGMSATLPNLNLLAKWLDAALFCTDFRPVPLTEHIKVDKRILDQDLQVQRELPASLVAVAPEDADHVIALCLETVTDGNAVLIFCPTKNWCEKLCETIAKKFHFVKHCQEQEKSNDEMQLEKETGIDECLEPFSWNLNLNRFKLAETVEQLRRCVVGIDPMLNRCILNGVAYHHAGLTFEERDIIEGAFRQGHIKVLIATSTLSSGVNLPARRVIVRTPMFHGHVIDTLTYKQMAGRAGRKGVDTQGESILICKPQEKLKGKNLLQAELPPVESCLHFNPEEGLSRSLKRAVLEVVVSGVAPSPEDVMTYVNCTLLSASINSDNSQRNSNDNLIKSCIQFLQDNEFVTVQKSRNDDGEEVNHFHPTLLGSAILASSLSPDEGLAVFAELQKARRGFVLDTDLHIIYLVTPMYASDISSTSLDWCHLYALWEALTPADRRVAEMVGVSEAFIARAINGRRINTKSEAQKRQLSVHLRFHTALILYDLVREVPLIEVAHKFNYNKGQLQSLQQSAATYAGMITVLCGRLGWHSLELLLSSFQHRLSSGVQPELVDLVRVSSLSATSARMLFNAGYSTVALLARAKPVDLENLFRSSVPFQSDKQQEGETAWEAKERQRARCIWLTGRKGVTELEAAEAIIQEAKDIVQGDLGGAAITWESEEEEGESECEEGLSSQIIIDSQEDKENQKVDQRSSQAMTKAVESNRETSKSKKNQGNFVTPYKSGNDSCLKENRDGNHLIEACAKSNLNIPSSHNPTTNCSHVDSEIVGRPEEGKNSANPENSLSRSVRRRSSKSFNISNTSSLNQSQKFGSGSRRNRKMLFGQTVLSPPVGVVNRSASKFVHKDQTPKNSTTSSVSIFDLSNAGKKAKPEGLNIEREMSQPSPATNQKISPTTDSHIRPEMQSANQIDMNQEISKEEKKGGDLSSMNEKYASTNEFDTQRDVNSFSPMMQEIQPYHSKDARSSQKPLSVSKTPKASNDFSFSGSFDLDTQAAQLLNCCDKRGGNSQDEIEMSKTSSTEKEIMLKQSIKAADVGKNMTNVLRNTKSDSFDDSLSEMLFAEVDKVTPADGILENKTDKGNCTKVNYLQYQVNEPDVSICSTENEYLENCMTIEEETEEQEESSLIAASDRFDHLDDCIIENESFDNSNVSFTKLKTKSSSTIETGRPKCFSVGESVGDSNCLQNDEDDNLLMAALDQSLSFDTSPLYVPPGQNHNKKVPQNSTPVDSCTELVWTLSNNTPKSHLSTSIRNDKKKRTPSNCIQGHECVDTSTSKATQSNQALSQIPEDFFTDSFSLTLMDKVMTECDKVQGNRGTGWDMTSSHQGEIHIKNMEREKVNLQSLPVASSKREMDGDKNPESANSSRHDGSDCVPPTPPDESTSYSSPLKMSFYSPLKPRPAKHLTKMKADDNVITFNCTNRDRSTVKKSSLKSRINNEQKTDCQGKATNMVTSNYQTNDGIQPPVHDKQLGVVEINSDSSIIQPLQPSKPQQPPLPQSASSCSRLIPPSQGTSQLTQQSFSIIDVCGDRRLFDSFFTEWREQTSFSLSLACEKLPPQGEKLSASVTTIGQRFTKKKAPAVQAQDMSHRTGIIIPDSKQMIVGLAISWENRDVYFVSLMPTGYIAACDPDDSLSEPNLDASLSQKERVLAICKILNLIHGAKPKKVVAYDVKAVYITLAKTFGVSLATCEDPRVADWIQAPTSRLKNLHHMVASFCPEELPLLDAVGGSNSYGSIGLDMAQGSASQASGRLRACTESVLARILMDQYYRAKLSEEDLLEAFTEVEMPALLTLARMELNGFGVSEAELESQKSLMTTKLTALEGQAYEMAGHVFSLTSTDDISKILYSELKLPINGDPSLMPQLAGGRGRGRRGRSNTGLIGSTSKETLEKLTKFHPLPTVVLEWRRLSSALTKSLYALQRTARECVRLNMPRVFGDCQIFTATGRVSMAEPNIQNIPKDFAIELPDYIGESPTASQPALRTVKKGSKLDAVRGHKLQPARIMDPDNVITAPVSMRKIFVPFKGGVLIAADYSQLELRVIAHLSGDSKLIAVLNSKDGDVFKMIASQMHNIEVEGVTPAQRQQAKQVCYGMLYGIGPKALGEQLGVDENDAGAFMEMFKSRYPGVRKYLRETVEFCQKNGYVKTMFNRRRFLPSIKHNNPHARAHAERQAVNTTVQGSAADLVKQAMVDIDRKLMQLFPDCRCSHSQRATWDEKCPSGTSGGRSVSRAPRGAFLVLQLHDELIYETSEDVLPQVAPLVKAAMEGAVEMSVSMPVKLKVGPSWGELLDFDVA